MSDYSSSSRRYIAWAVDVAAVFGILIILATVVESIVVPDEVRNMPFTPERQRKVNAAFRPVQVPVILGWIGLAVFYHTAGRKLRGGTLGYRVAGIRLVDAYGMVPTWSILIKRFLFGLVAVAPLGIGYLACKRNNRRQAGHDKWSGTWVIRKRAVPVGSAEITYHPTLVGPFLFTSVEIEPATGA